MGCGSFTCVHTVTSLSESCLVQQGACGTLVLLVSLMATCALCTYLRDCDGRRGCCTLVRGVRRAFDLRDSFYQLSAPRSKKSFDVLNFDVINGMRTLSMVLIILGHTYLCAPSPSTAKPNPSPPCVKTRLLTAVGGGEDGKTGGRT